MDLFTLQARLTLNSEQFESGLRQAKEKASAFSKGVEDSGNKLMSAGNKLTSVGQKVENVGYKFQPASRAVQDFGRSTIDATANFDKSMSNVAAISGATGNDLVSLRDTAKEWGRSTEYTATQVADAFSYMGMAGWKSEEMIAGIGPVLNLATASGEDLATTSDIVTDALTAFGLTADDAGGFADVLAAASTNANTNVGMLGESFKYAAPIVGTLFANAAGGAEQASKDTAVALGLMANSGIKASQAGTSLRSILTNMSKPTTQMQAAMDELGFSLTNADGSTKSLGQVMVDLRSEFGQLKDMTDEQKEALYALSGEYESGAITEEEYDARLAELTSGLNNASDAHKVQLAAMLAGKYGMSGLMAIVNATEEDFNQLTDAVEHSSDATDGYNGQADKMSSIMRDNLTGDMDRLSSAVEGLQISLGETMMPTLRDIAEFATGIIDRLNGLDEGTKKMIVQVGAAVAALAPVLIIGGKIITGAGAILKGIGAVMTFVGGTVIPGIVGGGGLIASIGSLATAAAPFLIGGAIIAGIIAAVKLIIDHWDEIKATALRMKEKVVEAWSKMKEGVGNLVEKLKLIVEKAWNGIKKAVEIAISGIKGLWENILSPVISHIGDGISRLANTFQNIFANIKSIVSEAFASIKYVWDNVLSAVFTGISNALGSLQNVFIDIWQGIVTVVSGAMDKMSGLYQTIFAPLLMTIGEALTNVRQTFANVWSAITTHVSDAFANIHEIYDKIFKRTIDNIRDLLDKTKKKFWRVFESIFDTVLSVFNSIRTTVSNFKENWSQLLDGIFEKAANIFSGIADTVTAVWDKVKGFAGGIKNFFTGGNKSKYYYDPYEVEWNAKASNTPYMFRGATLFGAGETTDEMLYGHDSLMNDIRAAVSGGGATDKLYNLLAEYLPEIVSNSSKEIVLDDGTLVGRIDRRLGGSMSSYRRGI